MAVIMPRELKDKQAKSTAPCLMLTPSAKATDCNRLLLVELKLHGVVLATLARTICNVLLLSRHTLTEGAFDNEFWGFLSAAVFACDIVFFTIVMVLFT